MVRGFLIPIIMIGMLATIGVSSAQANPNFEEPQFECVSETLPQADYCKNVSVRLIGSKLVCPMTHTFSIGYSVQATEPSWGCSFLPSFTFGQLSVRTLTEGNGTRSWLVLDIFGGPQCHYSEITPPVATLWIDAPALAPGKYRASIGYGDGHLKPDFRSFTCEFK
jgi:hypothetical protein